MRKPTLTVTADFTEKFNKTVQSFKRDAVLVGIPQDETQRTEHGQITNAMLLALAQFGSPAQNIPARPVMTIGIKKAQEQISEQLKLAVQKSFKEGTNALPIYYNRAGIIASNSIKKAINSQDGIDKPAESTIAARRSAGFSGSKALIVTGQMRNAITYVVKGGT